MSNRDDNAPVSGGEHTAPRKYILTEAMEILAKSRRSIYNDRKAGLLEFFQIGKKGHVYFIWEHFERYWQRIGKKGFGVLWLVLFTEPENFMVLGV